MIAYAITDPSTLNLNSLDIELERFSKKASMIVYRDKFNSDYATNASDFVEAAKVYCFNKIIIHGDYKLAKSIGADGVHFTSIQLNEISAAKIEDLFVIVSTHSLEELKRAERSGADMATFSPVFDTPNKNKAVGLKILKSVCQEVDIPIIALGGVLTQKQIVDCKDAGAKGFASIRYFA
jgi:thiamine-phosphate pyrophosphorylase